MPDYIAYAYAVGLFLGGLVGLNHEDQKTSIQFGAISASGAAYGAYLISQNPTDIFVMAFSAIFNAAFMSWKCFTSEKDCPWISGGLALASFFMIWKIFM